MGSQFSMGLYPDALEGFHAMDMEKIRRLYHRFGTLCEKEHENDGFFLTRRQFQVIFEIPTADAVFRIFAFFDPQQHGQVVASDVFGGLALASNSTESAKLQFIFQIADRNSDQFLNETELVMIMHSSSRGFSRMKKIEVRVWAKVGGLTGKLPVGRPKIYLFLFLLLPPSPPPPPHPRPPPISPTRRRGS